MNNRSKKTGQGYEEWFFSALLAVCMLLTCCLAWTIPGKGGVLGTTEKN